ncbi:MAG: hypothetical protein IKW03_01000 [Clostridia bacterium]|nr:hypothetical protein [Clostridia bacterium]
MNTYFNEITNKPTPHENGKILYKIPFGPYTGNGDVGIIFDDDEKGFFIHISKCDFWKFVPGAHKDGGIKTVGNIRFNNIDLSEYNVRQYFDRGVFECRFTDVEMQIFVAPENKIYIELKAPDNGKFPELDIEMPDTCGSRNFTFNDMGLKWCLRKFDGKEVERESAVTVCSRRLDTSRSDGYKTVRYCISVVSNFDDKEYVSLGIDLVSHCDYDKDRLKTEKKWKNFFSQSKVTLPDKEIEKRYNASLYLLACSMGNKEFPPGLFGNFVTDDYFPWAGDYHLNYNYEAPYYCVFSANHPELFDGYMAPVNEMIVKGNTFAKLFNCKGIAFPVSFGPKALDLYTQKDCKEHGILFLGQKSHAAYTAIIPIMHWFSTYDKKFAKENYYDFIVGVADFWQDYLVKEKGRYVIKNDAVHEIPYYRGEKFNYFTHKGQIEAVNGIFSLGAVRLLFKAVIDMSKELDKNTDKISEWQEILDNMSDFPTCIKKGKRCFRYSKKGLRWRDDNSVIIQHIYPASQVGLSSDKKTLKIAKNTYFIDDRRLDDNGSNSYLPAGARIGIDPAYIMEGIRQNIKEFGLPNMLFRHHGGGIEHLTMIPSTINEMLMQSHENVIRLFPCWDKKEDASFDNLRADGAFLVSSELKNGEITSLKIKSLKGRNCSVESDMISRIQIADSGKKVRFTKEGNIITFNTKPDTEYVLI